MAEWYYTQDGQQMGPVSGSQLKSLAASGGITREDLVWNQSLPEWAPAGRIRGLVFGASSEAPTAAPLPLPAAEPEAPAEEYAPQEPPSEEYYEQPAAAPAEPAATIAYQPPSGAGVPATQRSIELLRQTKPWVLLFSILLFIFGGIFVLGAVALLVAGLKVGLPLIIAGILYLGVGTLYGLPALFLGRYSSRIGALIKSGSSQDLESALEAQRSFWKFAGIVVLVMIGIYAITLIMFAVMMPALMRGNHATGPY